MRYRKKQSLWSYIHSESNRIREESWKFLHEDASTNTQQTGEFASGIKLRIRHLWRTLRPLSYVQLPNKKVKNARTSVHPQSR